MRINYEIDKIILHNYVFEHAQFFSAFFNQTADFVARQFLDVWQISEIPITNGNL